MRGWWHGPVGILALLLVAAALTGCLDREEASSEDALACPSGSGDPWEGYQGETKRFADDRQAIWGQVPENWSVEPADRHLTVRSPDPGPDRPGPILRIDKENLAFSQGYEERVEHRRLLASHGEATIVDDRNLTLAGHQAHCVAHTVSDPGGEDAMRWIAIQGSPRETWTVEQRGPADVSRELGPVLDRVLLSLSPIPPEGRDARDAATPPSASMELLDADGDGRAGWMRVDLASAAGMDPLAVRDLQVNLPVDGENLDPSSSITTQGRFLVCRSAQTDDGGCRDPHFGTDEAPALREGDSLYVGCRGNGTHTLKVKVLRVEVVDATPACEEWKGSEFGVELGSADGDGDGDAEWLTMHVVRGDDSPYGPDEISVFVHHESTVYVGSGNASASSRGVLVCRSPAWEEDRCRRPALGSQAPDIAVGDVLYLECMGSGEHRAEPKVDHRTPYGWWFADCDRALRSR